MDFQKKLSHKYTCKTALTVIRQTLFSIVEPKTPTPSSQPVVLESPGAGDQAGGLAPPPDNGEPEGSLAGEGEAPAKVEEVEAPKPKKKWMDFEQFCRCFK